jgi:ABC-type uncharacterized transport system substrate-binding protein
MRRRDFIKVVGGSAVTWPLAARAQQQHPMPVMAFLKSTTPDDSAHLVRAFRQGLSEAGFAEGRNVTIEYRWAENQLDRLPELVAELVRRRVAVIATPADTPATLVAKAATATIPIVFEIGGDPVRAGLVASFNQPGGNVTGITSMNLELAGKLLGLLHELLPQAARFAVLVNPNNSTIAEATITDARAAAMSIGRQIEVLTASTNREIDMAFASLGPKPYSRALGCNATPRFHQSRCWFSRYMAARRACAAAAPNASGLTHSWSIMIRSSTAVAYTSSRWRRTIGCQRSTPIVRWSKLGD